MRETKEKRDRRMEREIRDLTESEKRKEPGCERETKGNDNREIQKWYKKG